MTVVVNGGKSNWAYVKIRSPLIFIIFMNDFVDVLSLSDYIVVTDIYAAGELPIDGVTAEHLVAKLKDKCQIPTVYLKNEGVTEHLKNDIKSGDLILTLGAGDINQVADEFVKLLKNRNQNFASIDQRQSS